VRRSSLPAKAAAIKVLALGRRSKFPRIYHGLNVGVNGFSFVCRERRYNKITAVEAFSISYQLVFDEHRGFSLIFLVIFCAISVGAKVCQSDCATDLHQPHDFQSCQQCGMRLFLTLRTLPKPLKENLKTLSTFRTMSTMPNQVQERRRGL
jgi:hypothetical protein